MTQTGLQAVWAIRADLPDTGCSTSDCGCRPARGRPSPRRGVIRMRSKYLVGAATLAGVVVVSGCARSSQVDTSGGSPAPVATATPTTTATATPSARAFPEQAAIVSQYRAFFASLTPLSKVTYAVRYPGMRKLAVDPELTRVMGGIAAAQAAGEVAYGDLVVRPAISSITRDTAALTDCQDNSHHGRMKVATGKVVTVGRSNQLAKVTMRRGRDGVWRIATVEYAPEGSCEAPA